jgi:epoxyqueuosine reductase
MPHDSHSVIDVNQQKLAALMSELGADLFGIADITEARQEFYLPDSLKALFPSAIVLAKRVLASVLEEIKDRPTQLYFHHYRQLNNELDRMALRIASYIENSGYRALPIPASQIIDWKNQKAHLSHKKIGQLAGLGWIGRNNLLINPSLGARFRLVTVLTDLPLSPNAPVQGTCGSCFRCVNVCPAQAIHQSAADFDHLACFRKLDEFRRQGLVGQHICGVCVKACSGPIELE